MGFVAADGHLFPRYTKTVPLPVKLRGTSFLHQQTRKPAQGVAARAVERALRDVEPGHDLAVGHALHVGIVKHGVVVPDTRQGLRRTFFRGAERFDRFGQQFLNRLPRSTCNSP